MKHKTEYELVKERCPKTIRMIAKKKGAVNPFLKFFLQIGVQNVERQQDDV